MNIGNGYELKKKGRGYRLVHNLDLDCFVRKIDPLQLPQPLCLRHPSATQKRCAKCAKCKTFGGINLGIFRGVAMTFFRKQKGLGMPSPYRNL
jgi:hypothetical protein